jgi:hypothetical protein
LICFYFSNLAKRQDLGIIKLKKKHFCPTFVNVLLLSFAAAVVVAVVVWGCLQVFGGVWRCLEVFGGV